MKKFQQFLSLLLVFMMMVSAVPMSALAVTNEYVGKTEDRADDQLAVVTPDVVAPNAENEEAAELPDFSVASCLMPTLLSTDEVGIDETNPEILVFEAELSDMKVLSAEGDAVLLTDEQKSNLLALYQQYVDYRNANADVLGVQVPYYLQYNDETDELGPLGEVLSLAGIPLEAVRAGQIPYADLEGLLVIFLYANTLGVQLYGPVIRSARDEALQAVEDSGAKTEEQKLLVLNDWLAEKCNFDMSYIMGADMMQAENPQEHRYYQTVYDTVYDMYAESITDTTDNGIEQAAAQSAQSILNFWEGSRFGALGEGKSVCLGYADTYAYLVQCMHPEYYTKSGDYKSASDWKTDVKELYYTNDVLDINKGYYVDLVCITFETNVTMFGQTMEAFTSDHFWNAVCVDGSWYYVDSCYNDVFVETIRRNRAETDGNVNHMYFLVSHDSTAKLYSDSCKVITSLYADAAKDKTYESSWMARIVSDTTFADGYCYYGYSSADLIAMQDLFNRVTSGSGDSISEAIKSNDFRLVRHKLSDSDTGNGDTDFETLIEFNYVADEQTKETVVRVYNPATGAMEENAFLTALYAQHEADAQIYPSLAITCAKDGDLLYFNLSNYLLAYNLVSGEIIVIKEYTTVGAVRDKTNPFGAMAFSVADESGADLTVQNHPIAAIILKEDGNLYVSIATNYSYISGREIDEATHAAFEDPAANGKYGYEYEESNYNIGYFYPDSNSGNADSLPGYSSDKNDNDEFMWTANFVQTSKMSSVAVSPCQTHTYAAVVVDASCEHNAYTVNICAQCGAVENGTYAETADSIHNHHYIHYEETYYLKDENGVWFTGESYVCAECGFYTVEPAEPSEDQDYASFGVTYEEMYAGYVKRLAIWENAVATCGHEYTPVDAVWSADHTTVTFSKLICEFCNVKKDVLDCLREDDTIEITLDTALTAEVEPIRYIGDCSQGAMVTYCASGSLSTGGTYYITIEVPVSGHVIVIDKACEPTCTEPGLTEGRHCMGCDAETVAQNTIPALGCSFTEYHSNNDATCVADGTKTAACDHGCGATDTVADTGSMNPDAHTFGEWVIQDNKNYRVCELCGYTESKISTDSGEVEINAPEQPGLEFVVDPVAPAEDQYILVEEAVNKANDTEREILKVYNITLEDGNGVHVQPSGTVKVKLPMDSEQEGNYKVYRVNEDGTITDMKACRQGSHMVFETDHFSLYVIVEEAEGCTLSGTVTSFGDETAEITIQLIDSDNAVAYSTAVTGNSAVYTLSDLMEGTYTLKVTKPGHTAATCTVVVGTENVTQDITVWQIGDVNSDGQVNGEDRLALTRYLAKWTDYPASVINMDAADVNSDGKVNAQDRLILTRHLAGWIGYETLG